MDKEKGVVENQSTEENKKSKKKITKIIMIILIIAVLIILSGFVYYAVTSKARKAEEIFGNDNCEAILHMSTMDLVQHTCKICGAEFQDSSMHADICKQCAEDTDRCEFCGKKLSAEIKAQRENLIVTD